MSLNQSTEWTLHWSLNYCFRASKPAFHIHVSGAEMETLHNTILLPQLPTCALPERDMTGIPESWGIRTDPLLPVPVCIALVKILHLGSNCEFLTLPDSASFPPSSSPPGPSNAKPVTSPQRSKPYSMEYLSQASLNPRLLIIPTLPLCLPSHRAEVVPCIYYHCDISVFLFCLFIVCAIWLEFFILNYFCEKN